MQIDIRTASAADAGPIAAIYNHYVAATTISFEEQPVLEAEMAGRMRDVAAAGLPWLLAVHEGKPVGYAYATRWRARPAYRYSVESTVYLEDGACGCGWGALLYRQLIARLRDAAVRTVIAGIAQPNPRSVGLHERLGFRKVAHFPEVGFKFDKWVDVGYWQLSLAEGA